MPPRLLLSRLLLIEQNAVSLAGHYFAHTHALAQAGRRAALPVTILQNVRLREPWRIPGITARPVFSKDGAASDAVALQPWEPGNLAYEFAAAASPPPCDERVVFTTLSFAELLQLLALFTGDPLHMQNRHIHLVLRYDVEMLRDNLVLFRRYFNRIAEAPYLRNRILLHADTAALSQTLTQLTGLPVATLPVISDQTPLRRRGLAKRTGPLRAAYLGDARTEKNYAWLPSAVRWLWTGYIRPKRLSFVIQSNLNQPGGEPGILEAAQALGRYDPADIRLLPQPLSPADYRKLLEAADIVLLPYDAARYRHRSSGILIEAIAAGKPVVTTAGSWLADQVDSTHAVLIEQARELGPAIARIVDDYPRYATAARSIASQAAASHTGDALLQALLGSVSPPAPAGPRVLFVAETSDIAIDAAAWAVTLARTRNAVQAGYAASLLIVDDTGDATAAALARRFGFAAGAERVLLTSDRPACMKALAREPVVAVWLSRIGQGAALRLLNLNVPVIAAFDELECVHRAVQEARLVDEDAWAQEHAALRACARLVCGSPAIAERMRRSIPDHDAAIVPLTGRNAASRTLLLAGACDLAELAVQSGIDASEEALGVLAAMPGLDMILVTDPETRNGATWFIDGVFRPFLAPLGFNLLTIGPRHDVEPCAGLVSARGADRLDRLQAAAKLAIAPHGIPVEARPDLLDALALGLPVIAAPDIAPEQDPAAPASIQANMATQIITLLSSAPLRQQAARAAYGPGQTEAMQSALDAVLRPMLPRAKRNTKRRRPPHPVAESPHTEWGKPIQAANRLVRDHLAGQPLDETTLTELAAHNRAGIADMLRLLIEAAPESEPGDDQALLLALDVHAGPPSSTWTISAHSGFPLETSPTLSHPAPHRRVPRFVVQPIDAAQIWQVIPLRTDAARILGRMIVASEQPASTKPFLLLKEGERAGLNLPAILATGPAKTWVELTTDRDAQLRFESGGQALAVSAVAGNDAFSRHFVSLPMPSSGLLALEITCLSGHATLFEVRSGISRGRGAPEPHAGSKPAAELLALATAILARSAEESDHELLLACSAGRPGQPAALTRLQRNLRNKQGGTTDSWRRDLILEGLTQSEDVIRSVLAAALPRETLAGAPSSYAGGPGLSAEISAQFVADADSSGPVCSVNGIVLDERGPRRWHAPGRPGGICLHRLTFARSGQPVSPERVKVTFRLPATLDPVTRDANLDRSGFHRPEYADGKPDYVWTGPQPTSRIDLPVAPLSSGRIAIRLVHPGRNLDRDDFTLSLNNQVLAHELRELDGALHLEATFAANPDGAAICSVRLTVRHVFSSESEPRTLGVAIKEVLLEMTL